MFIKPLRNTTDVVRCGAGTEHYSYHPQKLYATQ